MMNALTPLPYSPAAQRDTANVHQCDFMPEKQAYPQIGVFHLQRDCFDIEAYALHSPADQPCSTHIQQQKYFLATVDALVVEQLDIVVPAQVKLDAFYCFGF